MREAAFELLERLNGIKDESTRVGAIHQAATSMGRFTDLIYYGLSPKVEFKVPTGEPPYKPSDEVNTHSNFWTDIRRVYLFVKGGKDGLTDMRRQQLFIEMLEYVHPKDAQLLLLMVERKWPFDNISAELIEKIFPGLLDQVVVDGGSRR